MERSKSLFYESMSESQVIKWIIEDAQRKALANPDISMRTRSGPIAGPSVYGTKYYRLKSYSNMKSLQWCVFKFHCIRRLRKMNPGKDMDYEAMVSIVSRCHNWSAVHKFLREYRETHFSDQIHYLKKLSEKATCNRTAAHKTSTKLLPDLLRETTTLSK